LYLLFIKKVYHLSTCSTCKRIIKELNINDDFQFQNIKENPISEKELEQLYAYSGNYENLLNKRSTLYKERKLKEIELSEVDCKNLILEHYSFLKRPIIQVNETYFIGNAKKTIAEAKEFLEKL